jgi:hypothetical protein
MFYAVYQSGYEIMGVGETMAVAIMDAEAWLGHVIASLTPYGLEGPRGEMRGQWYLRPCTQEVYEEVHRRGGSTPYVIDDAGCIVFARHFSPLGTALVPTTRRR